MLRCFTRQIWNLCCFDARRTAHWTAGVEKVWYMPLQSCVPWWSEIKVTMSSLTIAFSTICRSKFNSNFIYFLLRFPDSCFQVVKLGQDYLALLVENCLICSRFKHLIRLRNIIFPLSYWNVWLFTQTQNCSDHIRWVFDFSSVVKDVGYNLKIKFNQNHTTICFWGKSDQNRNDLLSYLGNASSRQHSHCCVKNRRFANFDRPQTSHGVFRGVAKTQTLPYANLKFFLISDILLANLVSYCGCWLNSWQWHDS
jgi:hypothetical protein